MALVQFKDGFKGTYEAGNQTLQVGDGGLVPYDMTYGALSACLYSNFLKHAKAAGADIKGTDVYVDGRKRSGVPATSNMWTSCSGWTVTRMKRSCRSA